MAEAVGNLVPKAVHEVKAGHVAEVEEGTKVALVARVELEAKAGVRARAEARVICGARARSGGPGHEVAVVKRAVPKTERGRGAPATTATAV